MTVYFHGSFGINREYMAGVLAASLKNPGASGNDIAAPFGDKAPFMGRYKSWLHKTGLTTKGRTIKLAPIGEDDLSRCPSIPRAAKPVSSIRTITSTTDR